MRMSTPSRWRGDVIVINVVFWKMSLYSVLNDRTNRELRKSSNRLSNFEYFTVNSIFARLISACLIYGHPSGLFV